MRRVLNHAPSPTKPGPPFGVVVLGRLLLKTLAVTFPVPLTYYSECPSPEYPRTYVYLNSLEHLGDGEVDAGGSGVGQDKRAAMVASSGSTPGSPLVSRTACHFLDQS